VQLVIEISKPMWSQSSWIHQRHVALRCKNGKSLGNCNTYGSMRISMQICTV